MISKIMDFLIIFILNASEYKFKVINDIIRNNPKSQLRSTRYAHITESSPPA